MEKLKAALAFGGILAASDIDLLAASFKLRQVKAGTYLRRLGVNFMRMIPMKENEQQKASEILNISMKKQRELSGTSSIKK